MRPFLYLMEKYPILRRRLTISLSLSSADLGAFINIFLVIPLSPGALFFEIRYYFYYIELLSPVWLRSCYCLASLDLL